MIYIIPVSQRKLMFDWEIRERW